MFIYKGVQIFVTINIKDHLEKAMEGKLPEI